MNLGTVGVDALMDSMAGAEVAQFARKIEKLGYGALWFPEAFRARSVCARCTSADGHGKIDRWHCDRECLEARTGCDAWRRADAG